MAGSAQPTDTLDSSTFEQHITLPRSRNRRERNIQTCIRSHLQNSKSTNMSTKVLASLTRGLSYARLQGIMLLALGRENMHC